MALLGVGRVRRTRMKSSQNRFNPGRHRFSTFFSGLIPLTSAESAVWQSLGAPLDPACTGVPAAAQPIPLSFQRIVWMVPSMTCVRMQRQIQLVDLLWHWSRFIVQC